MENSADILAFIFAVAHSAPPPEQKLEACSSPPPPPLIDALWKHAAFRADGTKHARSLPERAVNAAMKFLFQDNLCVMEPSKEVVIDGVDVARLWRTDVGVGPGAPENLTLQPQNSQDLRQARSTGLNLLICTLVGQAPLMVAKMAMAAAEKVDNAGKPAAASAVIAEDRPRPIADTRLLAYLVDPANDVPFRKELFFSLLSTVFSYNPTVPYMYIFSNNEEETFVHVCLSVLCLLLHDHVQDDGCAGSLLKWFPQECLDKKAPAVLGEVRRHVFRELVANLRGGAESVFLACGAGEMLESPTSIRAPPFLAELLLVVMNLAGSEEFISAVRAEEEASTIVTGLLLIMDNAPEHVDKDVFALLVGVTVLRFTAAPTLYETLTEEYTGIAPDGIVSFEGSACDIIALVALNTISDRLSTSLVIPMHSSIVEVCFGILVNLSTFAEGFNTAVSCKMFSIFNRCSKVAQLKKGTMGLGKYLPLFLESIGNIVQYQYHCSENVVYGMMTRKSDFDDVMSFVTTAVSAGRAALDSAEPSSPTTVDGEKKIEGEIVIKQRRENMELWSEMQKHLAPLVGMIAAVAPLLEQAIEKKDLHSADEAKECLPKSALGMLPVPHAFALRSIGNTSHLTRAFEICSLGCIVRGPIGGTWDMKEKSAAIATRSKKGSKAPNNGKKSQTSGRDGKVEGVVERRRRSRSATSRSGVGVTDSATGGHGPVRGGGAMPRNNSRVRNSSRTTRVISSYPAHSQLAPAASPAVTATPEAPAVPAAQAVQLQLLNALVAQGVDLNALLLQAAANAGNRPAATDS
eukprot:TRINITY_DN9946_c0_g2_i1.p1 TRINITY_DN9946_c0_g2~~TRINITY_DN9946_c0_g2_i1.p1  ORF type:complete len:922 (+),score=176.17 TRINITY_DN9946_c0_g2_i1:357-2768(+)